MTGMTLRNGLLTCALSLAAALGACAGNANPPQVAVAAAPAAASEIVETAVPGFAHAKIWRQAGDEPRPVIVILHGADGGDEAGRRFGPILARLGYAAVGLPYYSANWGEFGPPPQFPDLPGSFIDIRVDQIADLRDALRTLPGVDVERFGLLGGSKGSEFALIAASRYNWVDSVVAYTPSDVVWEGWGLEMLEAEGTRSSFSFDGQPLAFMPYHGFVDGLLAGDAADLYAIHENGRADHPELEADARIPAEAYKGALMLIAGEKDANWNSAAQARNIAKARSDAGLTTEVLIYPDAGHDLIGYDAEPRDVHRSGGTPEANAAARVDAWPQVVAFLEVSLGE